MKFAIIADIHSNLPALEKVLEDIKLLGIEKIYCAGDLVGYLPFPNEVIDLIKTEEIETIQGNYDESVGNNRLVCGCDFKNEEARIIGEGSLNWSKLNTSDENKEFLRNLPKKIQVNLADKNVVIVHGSPRKQNEYLFENTNTDYLNQLLTESNADILICGHTHLPYHLELEKGHIINAGSAGKPKHGNPNTTYVIVEINNGQIITEIREVPYDYEKTVQAIKESDLPKQIAEKIAKGIG